MLRHGIRQGWLASGALWALLFDPVVRRLIAWFPRVDLQAALGSVVVGLRAFVPVLLEMRLAVVLLHAGKTKVLVLSDRGGFDLRRRLADIPMAGSFVFRGAAFI